MKYYLFFYARKNEIQFALIFSEKNEILHGVD